MLLLLFICCFAMSDKALSEEQLKQVSKLNNQINEKSTSGKTDDVAKLYITKWRLAHDYQSFIDVVDHCLAFKYYTLLFSFLEEVSKVQGIEYNDHELLYQKGRCMMKHGMYVDDTELLLKAKGYYQEYQSLAHKNTYRSEIIQDLNTIGDVISGHAYNEIAYLVNNEAPNAGFILRNCEKFIQKYPTSKYLAKVKQIQKNFMNVMQLTYL